MEKKMESTIVGLYRSRGYIARIMENQMEKNMENEKETVIIKDGGYIGFRV